MTAGLVGCGKGLDWVIEGLGKRVKLVSRDGGAFEEMAGKSREGGGYWLQVINTLYPIEVDMPYQSVETNTLYWSENWIRPEDVKLGVKNDRNREPSHPEEYLDITRQAHKTWTKHRINKRFSLRPDHECPPVGPLCKRFENVLKLLAEHIVLSLISKDLKQEVCHDADFQVWTDSGRRGSQSFFVRNFNIKFGAIDPPMSLALSNPSWQKFTSMAEWSVLHSLLVMTKI
ncbi:hypothetical protein Tco_0027178 [Tanacetum coccineum]